MLTWSGGMTCFIAKVCSTWQMINTIYSVLGMLPAHGKKVQADWAGYEPITPAWKCQRIHHTNLTSLASGQYPGYSVYPVLRWANPVLTDCKSLLYLNGHVGIIVPLYTLKSAMRPRPTFWSIGQIICSRNQRSGIQIPTEVPLVAFPWTESR